MARATTATMLDLAENGFKTYKKIKSSKIPWCTKKSIEMARILSIPVPWYKVF